MSLQFIEDSAGKTTGVYIPIKDWAKLKAKYEGIEQEETNIPGWQKELVRERIQNTKSEDYLSWEEVEQKIKFD